MNININRKAIIKTLICASGFLLFSNNASNAQNNTTLQEVQEIVAIVNDKIISLYDLEQRTLLIKLAGGDRELSEADEDYLQQQAMQALIDDRLKIQEAAKYESIMEEKDVLDSYNNYASQFELKPEELEAQMENQGVVKNTLLDQIRGSMAWQSIVGGLLEQQVNVTDDEVDNYIDKMERLKGKDQY
ncbi:MAG: hypothetical protein HOH19_12340, partial [Kordiimonadaceae bacterium]|nr:hypothetical protein [Kordiimonadaceae bacterium]